MHVYVHVRFGGGADGKGLHEQDLASGLSYLESTTYRFPWRAWPPFEQAFEAAQSQLRSALARYEADYLAIRTSVVSTFERLAADSARRLQATGQPLAIDFEETIVREVVAALPEPDLLWRPLSLRYRDPARGPGYKNGGTH